MTKRGGRGATPGCGEVVSPMLRKQHQHSNPRNCARAKKPAQGFYRIQFNIPIENVNDPFIIVLAATIKDIVGNFGASDFKVFKKEIK